LIYVQGNFQDIFIKQIHLFRCRIFKIGNDNNKRERTAPERYFWPLLVVTFYKASFEKSDITWKDKK
jgi:hypothetical protein